MSKFLETFAISLVAAALVLIVVNYTGGLPDDSLGRQVLCQ